MDNRNKLKRKCYKFKVNRHSQLLEHHFSHTNAKVKKNVIFTISK